MPDASNLEWHNLDGLRGLCDGCPQSEYLTIASLADDRKESQLFRVDLGHFPTPYTSIVRLMKEKWIPKEGLPVGGRLRFRVRLWGWKGHPLGGVVVRIEPPGATPRRRRTSRPKPTHRAQKKPVSHDSLSREVERLSKLLTTERLKRRVMQDDLSEACRKSLHVDWLSRRRRS